MLCQIPPTPLWERGVGGIWHNVHTSQKLKNITETCLWYFHQKIVITCITYTIAIYYYMHYLSTEIEDLKTEN